MEDYLRLFSKTDRTFIVESFSDKKRMPVSDPYSVVHLDSATVFCNDGDISIPEIFKRMKENENENPVIDPKGDQISLKKYFKTIVPEYDEMKVYASDIKKIISWYIILKDILDFSETDAKGEEIPLQILINPPQVNR